MENIEIFFDALSSTGTDLFGSIGDFIQGLFGAVEGLFTSSEATGEGSSDK